MGKTVAQHSAKEWLRRRRNATERTSTLVELAAAELASPLRRSKLDNALEAIGFQAAEQLEPLLAAEFGALPDNEVAAAVAAAVDALRKTDLSDDALFATDADPEVLARTIRRQLPDQPRRACLSEPARALYERVVDQGCRYLIQIVRQLPAFQPRALAEVLDRLSTVAGQLTEILTLVPLTRLDAPRGSTHDEDFRVEYLRYLAATLDRLDLLGLTMRYRPRLALSVAYLSLTVSGQAGHRHRFQLGPDRLAGQWFDHLADPNRTSTARVESAIGSARRTLVRGEAGSGKTTLLDWLAVTAARRGFTGALAEWNGCVPFPVRLRHYVGTDLPRPEQFLDYAARWLAGIMPEGWVHRCLRSGEALVLVDGVDEVPAAQRRVVRSWLGELVIAYPNARIVVTARTAAAEERWLAAEDFTSVVLEQLSPGDVRMFLERWHEAATSAEALPCDPANLPDMQRRLLAQLDARPHLRALAANPLLCAMLCALNLVRIAELPHNRMELYQAAIAMLIDLRDAERGIPGLLNVTEKTVLLRDLAWRLTLGNLTELSRTRVLDHVTRKLRAMPNVDERPEMVLDYLLERSGVIREPVPGRVDFVHRTFQEYLAASEATEEEHIDTLVSHAHLDSWRETIVMACGHAKRSQLRDLLTAILDRAEAEPRCARRLRLLAAACLETITDVDPEVQARVEAVITDRLVPPRGIRETRSLAAIGHRLLRYLPERLDALSGAAAVATVRAAALTDNADALTHLARYAEDPRQAVQAELVSVWRYFDPERYAAEVLADMPLVNGRLTVQLSRLLPFTKYLRHLESVWVEVETEGADLTFLADVEKVTHLSLACTGVLDLGPLADHHDLRRVNIFGADDFTGLSTLCGLSNLDDLVLDPASSDISFVEHLNEDLRILGLCKLYHTRMFDPLRTRKRLDSLYLYDCPHLSTLEPVAHLTHLDTFGLSKCSLPNPAEQISQTFPTLRALMLFQNTATDLTPLTKLPLTFLNLRDYPEIDLRPLAAMASLKTLCLGCPGLVDLSPLTGKTLRLNLERGREYRGRDELGPGVKIDYF